MAQITVKYDPTIVLESIEDPMYATSTDESPYDKPAEIQQTKVTGIIAPLIKVNKININWGQIKSFELKSIGFLPTLSFTFEDTLGFTKSLDQPKSDNIVRVQILPPFDNAYKKVNLRFYMTNVSINGMLIHIDAIYNVPGLYQSKLEAFGKLSTYELADKIAKESELGFATNIDGVEDKRYMYCNNMNYIDAYKKELTTSGTETCILDSWIDFHNYLILCDLYERYNANDNELKVWTSGTPIPDVETDVETKPFETDAIISNAQAMIPSQLYMKNYKLLNNSRTNVNLGTDKILEVYNMTNSESNSVLVQDGDIKKDSFIKTIYLGEQFGDFNYQLQQLCRISYLQKINSTCIEAELKQPMLGLERGNRVNVKWYEMNEMVNTVKNQNPISTNIPDEEGEPNDADSVSLNKQVSGQYLIIGTTVSFSGLKDGWSYKLLLSRPIDQIKSYVEDE